LDYFNSNFWQNWRYLYVYEYEYGFALLVYFCAKLAGNIYFVQFSVQLLTILPVYFALKKNNGGFPLWVGMLAYYLMFYNTSLNTMRQCIAVSFCFLALQYFRDGNIKKYILFQIVALLFHYSAIVGLVTSALFYYIYGNPTKREQIVRGDSELNIRVLLASVIALVTLFGATTLTRILTYLGLGRFEGYISGDISYMPNQIITRLPIILLCFWNWKKLEKNNIYFKFHFAMLICSVILAQFTSVNAQAGRICSYFEIFYLELLPKIFSINRYKHSGKIKISAASLLVIGFMMFYWWFFFVYRGTSSTVPYIVGEIWQ